MKLSNLLLVLIAIFGTGCAYEPVARRLPQQGQYYGPGYVYSGPVVAHPAAAIPIYSYPIPVTATSSSGQQVDGRLVEQRRAALNTSGPQGQNFSQWMQADGASLQWEHARQRDEADRDYRALQKQREDVWSYQAANNEWRRNQDQAVWPAQGWVRVARDLRNFVHGR